MSGRDASVVNNELTRYVRAVATTIKFLFGPALDTWDVLRRSTGDAGGATSSPLQLDRLADLVAFPANVVAPVRGDAFVSGRTTPRVRPPTWLLLSKASREKVVCVLYTVLNAAGAGFLTMAVSRGCAVHSHHPDGCRQSMCSAT